MARLSEKKALITGGTTGIGFATAKHFLEKGAQVAISGQNQERLQDALSKLGHNTIGASIVLNTSCLDEMGMPGMSIYSASKAAVRSLARSLSAELVGQGIRVNAVSPGPIETPIYSKLGMPAEAVQSMAEGLIGQIPMGRFGQADEVAKAILFLASDDSSFMLGEEIVVDGGWSKV
jgi:NAD(P)-dependent dehydrogenase (short-subunit alcohol dehydrogenase family)